MLFQGKPMKVDLRWLFLTMAQKITWW